MFVALQDSDEAGADDTVAQPLAGMHLSTSTLNRHSSRQHETPVKSAWRLSAVPAITYALGGQLMTRTV